MTDKMKKEEKEIRCAQCNKTLEPYGQFNWHEGLGQNMAYVCENPECPNYGLLQFNQGIYV